MPGEGIKELGKQLTALSDSGASPVDFLKKMRSMATRDLEAAVEPDDRKFFYNTVFVIQKEIAKMGVENIEDPDELEMEAASRRALSLPQEEDLNVN